MENSVVEYIKSHVSTNLSFQPQLQQEVAKTLLSLLKIRQLKEYVLTSFIILIKLEEKLQRLSMLKKELEKESLGFVILHETKKAAIFFSEITNKEAQEVKQYLESLVKKEDATLENYMSKELGLPSQELYNPDDAFLDLDKVIVAFSSMLNSGNLEDFQFNLNEPVPEEKIKEIITKYYTERGYMEKKRNDPIYFSWDSIFVKNKEELLIGVTNPPFCIMVSVMQL